jgi:acetylornithine deacetylase/succinyl-diaminopimelate desuccinylase-like protein
LARFYADDPLGSTFQYNQQDIFRARRNEEQAALHGLRAEIENPFSGLSINMRDFLRWTLGELQPLAEALGKWDDLTPLVQMAEGAPNTAEQIRARLKAEMGTTDIVPTELLRKLPQERLEQVIQDIEKVAETYQILDGEAVKFGEFLQRARDDVHADPLVPVRYRPRMQSIIEIAYPDVTSEILELAQELVRIPSVTACPQERLEEVRRAATLIYDYTRYRGLGVRYYYQDKYPALLIGFPGQMHASVMLGGHFDVVSPEPDDRQFDPRIDGDYLWGRGSADMKSVVATYLVWMKDVLREGPPFPPINLLLVGNEENGEGEAMGTPHILRLLQEEYGYQPKLFIAGERTGESGNELWGEICVENRGVMRFNVIAQGRRGHTGVSGLVGDMTERILKAQDKISEIFREHLTLNSSDGWQSQVKYPFIQVGTPGIYNISADKGILGVEVRPIPQDNIEQVFEEISDFCTTQDLVLDIEVRENGIVCDLNNAHLISLIESVRSSSKCEPRIGKKLPGTSARFAPGGQGIVWGQSGIDPHGKEERHYIPSIAPYYHALSEFGRRLSSQVGWKDNTNENSKMIG